MQLPHRHAGNNAAEVSVAIVLYSLFQESIYHISLDRHTASLRGYDYIHGSGAKDHGKLAICIQDEENGIKI